MGRIGNQVKILSGPAAVTGIPLAKCHWETGKAQGEMNRSQKTCPEGLLRDDGKVPSCNLLQLGTFYFTKKLRKKEDVYGNLGKSIKKYRGTG